MGFCGIGCCKSAKFLDKLTSVDINPSCPIFGEFIFKGLARFCLPRFPVNFDIGRRGHSRGYDSCLRATNFFMGDKLMKNTLIAGTVLLAALVAFMPAQADDKGKIKKKELEARISQLEKETSVLQQQLTQIFPVVNRLEVEVKELQGKK